MGVFMVEIRCNEMSLAQICGSGQCFRMYPVSDGWFELIAGDRFLRVGQEGEKILFDCDRSAFDSFWRDYFDLDTDYAAFIERINPNDRYLLAAAEYGWGMRILKQDLWEVIVSFLISQQNHIKRIRRCIDQICIRYGKKCINERGEIYYAFPEPRVLALEDEDALKACNLGYRSKYVVRTARMVAEGRLDLDRIKDMPYHRAKKALLDCSGIGEKVADCICLFGLHHLQAFPVDTHIRQALDAHYKRGFPNRRYRDCRGAIQQYIFYYELDHTGI